jgi:transposase-like protein
MFETVTDEELQRTIDAYEENGKSIRAAAAALGIQRSTLRRRLKRAAERGLLDTMPIMPGFRIKQTSAQLGPDGELQKEWIKQTPEPNEEPFAVPAGHLIKGVSALVDPDNRVIQQWIKTKEGADGVDWPKLFESAFKDFVGRALPVIAPAVVREDFINLIPCNDWHINLLCWSREVGENWDLKIAERVIGDAIASVIERTRCAGTAVVLGGGDLMHNDDNSNRTAKSHNVLDADGRHEKGLEVAQRLKVRTIDAALQRNGKVIVRILKGNHDEQSSVAIAHFLKAWYRNEPRVTVDLDSSLFWYYEFGKVMLAATHGHAAKLANMPGIMATRRPEMWGRTRFRFAHGFHVHHREKRAPENAGVVLESHQAPIPGDSWHHGEGYLAARSVQTITYHKLTGEHSRTIEGITSHEANQETMESRAAA